MSDFLNLSTCLSLASSLISLLLMLYFWAKAKRSSLLYSFLFFLAMIFLWPLSGIIHQILNAFQVYDKLPHFYGCVGTQFFTMCFIGSSWLVFCLLYTNSKLLGNKWIIPGVFLLSLIFFIASMIRRYHLADLSIVYYERIWIKLTAFFTFIVASVIVLLIYAVKQSGYLRRQAILLIIGISFSQMVIIYEAYCDVKFGYFVLPFSGSIFDIDASPVGFLISALIIAIATFKYKFMELRRIAQEKVFDTMSEAILVLDGSNKIDDFNKSFINTFSCYGEFKRNEAASRFFNILKDNAFQEGPENLVLRLIDDFSPMPVSDQLILEKPARKCFFVNVHPIYIGKRNAIGKVISFTDITSYSSAIEELTTVKERNRIARDIHDTLGHTMTVLLTLLKVSGIKVKTDPDEAFQKIMQTITIAQDGLKELRRSVSGLAPEKLASSDILIALRQLFSDFKPSGAAIDFVMDGTPDPADNLLSSEIYHICQEALTNAVRHGNAKNISVTLRFDETGTRLLIIDDGGGCSDIKKGFGLNGMEERVKCLNGSLKYGSDGETGFSVFVEIPIRLNPAV